jgi:Tol biopolymer transport system component
MAMPQQKRPTRASRLGLIALAAGGLGLAGCGSSTPPGGDGGGGGGSPDTVVSLQPSAVQGLQVWSPDGRRYLLNREDANGVAQVYLGDLAGSPLVCLTDVQRPDGPKPGRMKMQPHWHPSGEWIFLAAERDEYTVPFFLAGNRDFIEGELQCGLWTDMWSLSTDGLRWRRHSDFHSGIAGVADGYIGPVITPDGRTLVWSQIIDGNVFTYWPFGRWQLIQADCALDDGGPVVTNRRDITPSGMHWNEPGNFHPDGRTLLLTGSVLADAQGQDQYLLDLVDRRLTNLTNSPTVWDEHGVFSPDGGSIIWMSSWPYRADPDSGKILTIKTEFMRMRADGSGLVQLTHFLAPGFPESSPSHGIAACAEWSRDGRSAQLSRLIFPNYEYWDIVFGSATAPAPAPSLPLGPG